MADKKKSHKVLKITGLVLLSIIVIVGALIGLDYKSYKNGNRSVLFGTLDNYNESQTLKFGNLNLKVTSVNLKAYPTPTPPAQSDCSSLFTTPTQSEYIANRGLIPYGGAQYSLCELGLSSYQQSLNQSKSSDNLTVNYKYSNVSNQPLNMGDYKIKLIANTPFYNFSCDSPSGLLLKGNQLTGCKSNDIAKTYHGALSLVVTNNNKEKTISLSLPE